MSECKHKMASDFAEVHLAVCEECGDSEYDIVLDANRKLEAELEDTVTECLGAKSNEDILRKQLAALRERLTLIRDDLRMRSEDGVVDKSRFC